VLSQIIDREALKRQLREDAQADAATLTAHVETDGAAWFHRVEAELRAAAETFNARIGRPVFRVSVTASGQIVLDAQGETDELGNAVGYVTVIPYLSTAPRSVAPGAIVEQRQHRCDQRIPYTFDLEGDELRMFRAGERLSPEAFTRAILTPYLTAITLRAS